MNENSPSPTPQGAEGQPPSTKTRSRRPRDKYEIFRAIQADFALLPTDLDRNYMLNTLSDSMKSEASESAS